MKTHLITPATPRAIQIGPDYSCPDGKTALVVFRLLLPDDPNPAYPRLAVLHDRGGRCWTLLAKSADNENIVGENGECAEYVILRHPQEHFPQREFRRAVDIAENRYVTRTTLALPILRQINELLADDALPALKWLAEMAEHPDVYEAGIVDGEGYPTRQTLADRHPESEYFVAWDNGHSTGENSFRDACGVACGGDCHGSDNARIYDAVPDDGRILEPHEFVLRASTTIPRD